MNPFRLLLFPVIAVRTLYDAYKPQDDDPLPADIIVPPGEPEIRMEVTYGKETLPVFQHENPGNIGFFTNEVHDVATIRVFFNDVAWASIQKLGLERTFILSENIESVTDKKEQQSYREAPHIYGDPSNVVSMMSPYQRRFKLVPLGAFHAPLKIVRPTNADLQGAVARFQAKLKELKALLPAARGQPNFSAEI